MLRPSDHSPTAPSSGSVFDGLRAAAADVAADWKIELVALGKSLWARYARDRRASLTLGIGEARVSITTDAAEAPIATIALPSGPSDAEFIAELKRVCGLIEAALDVTLTLPESSVLRASVSMPKTSKRTLAQALRYELAHLCPLPVDALYFDFAASPARGSQKQQDVEVRIVKRADVDAAVSACRHAGLAVASLRFAGDARPADWRSFPVGKLALIRSLWRRFSVPLLACLAVVCGLVFLAGAYERRVAAGEILANEVAAAEQRAAQVQQLRLEAQALTAEGILLEQKKQAPMLAAVLAELSRTLPDDTWITQLSVDGSKVRLEGSSKAAANLIGILDRSDMFANAQFAAPLTQDARSNVERFDLVAEIRARRP